MLRRATALKRICDRQRVQNAVNPISGRFLAIYHIHHCISFTLTSTVFLKFSI